MVDGLVSIRADDIVPLYHQVKENLTMQIRAGRWGPEDEFPSEYVADVLSIDAGSPLFLVERFCYTRQDTIGEYRRGFQRGDIYRHRIDLR